MILYLWMHWFWITTLCLYGIKSESSAIHSATTNSPEMRTSYETEEEQVSIFVTPPPNNRTPSNNSTSTFQKNKTMRTASKKYNDKLITINRNGSKVSSMKESTVINLNTTTEKSNVNNHSNVTADLIHLNITNFNNHNNITSFLGNETNFNESQLLNSERIMNEETEEVSDNLSAAGITGISLGCVIVVGIFCFVTYIIYHNRGFNRPQVLNDRCSNPDSSGYLDDASVRDNSEEMYSLDNDSFLNSLEAMTIQNYWTDTVKHTKL